MRLGEGDHGARLQCDNVDVHVVAHVGGIDETRGGPAAICAGHDGALGVLVPGDDRFRLVEARHGLVDLADPVEAGGRLACVVQGPWQARRQIGVMARREPMCRALIGDLDLPIDDEQYALRACVRLGGVTAASSADFHHIMREGFGKS